mgnify:CR=1 FL=1
MKTAVLIPCYNEAKTIGRVVADFKEKMPHADILMCMIIIRLTIPPSLQNRPGPSFVTSINRERKCGAYYVPGSRCGLLCNGGWRRYLSCGFWPTARAAGIVRKS